MTVRLGDVAEMNPRGDLSHLSDDTVVGFVPMSAVSEITKTITYRPRDPEIWRCSQGIHSDEKRGCYRCENYPLL